MPGTAIAPISLLRASCVACLALSWLGAQSQFALPLDRGLPTDFDETVSVALGDIDGDGDLDLFTSAAFTRSRPFRNRLFENDGRGNFRDVSDRLIWNVEAVGAPQFVDVDGDGDLDLIAFRSGISGPVQVVLNDGTGRFTDASSARLPAGLPDSGAVVVGDIDGDGDVDILGLGYTRPSVQLRNDGAGVFTDTTTQGFPALTGAVISADLADVDGDGDLDLLCGRVASPTTGGPDGLFLNDGTGRFVEATASNLPFDAEITLSARLFDVDGDGDRDAVLTSYAGGVRLYENDGAGVFTNTTGRLSVSGSVGGIAAWDPDLDGDVDLVFGGERYFENDGSGNFSEPRGLWPRLPRGWPVAGDVDGDGDEDLVVGLNGPNRLVLSHGGGVPFEDATRTALLGGRGSSADLVVADLDRDAELDVVFLGEPVRVFHGDSGRFAERTKGIPPNVSLGYRSAVAAGDVDLDGDSDLVFGTMGLFANGDRTQLFLNGGAGSFSDFSSNLPADSDRTRDVLLVDIDGDGDLDVFLANEWGPDRLYLNDRNGNFTDATQGLLQTIPAQSSYSVAVGDVDGDGRIDLLVGGHLSQPPANRLYRNTGGAMFTDASADLPQAQLDVSGQEVFLEDIDGDGDLDALFVDRASLRLCLNDGAGVFTDASSQLPVPPPTTLAWGAAVDDFDGDGDLDVIAHGSLMLNDGAGTFVRAQDRWPVTPYVSTRLATADMDGDGDVDLIDNREQLFRNLCSQVEWQFSPQVGRDAVFIVHGQRRTTSLWAFPFASALLSQAVPTSAGLLHLDLTQLVGLPTVVVPPGAGSVSVSVPVPAAPFLIGAEFGLQAGFFEPATSRVWLSNPDRDRVIR